MTQGNPPAMIAYVIGVLLMIKQLKAALTDITQPCYVDDAVALGTYGNIDLYSNCL